LNNSPKGYYGHQTAQESEVSKDRELLERLFSIVESQDDETIEEIRDHLFPKPKPNLEFEYALESLPPGTIVRFWDDPASDDPEDFKQYGVVQECCPENEDYPFFAGPCNWKHIAPLSHPWIAFKPNASTKGTPPVHPDQHVEVWLREGHMLTRKAASVCNWMWNNGGTDVIAYRIVTRY
jgi:hypothetical protein